MHHSSSATATFLRPRAFVVLHWTTLLALCLGVAAIWIRDIVDGRTLRLVLLETHRHAGLLVLGFGVTRIALRARHRAVASAGGPLLLRIAAAVTHLGLYALLLALPLLGWAASNAQGHSVDLLGWPLPSLVVPNEDLGDELMDWHVDAAWAMLVLAVLHASAALWHHFVVRDAVLTSMLPSGRRP